MMEYMPRGSLHQLMRDRQAEILWDVLMPIGMDITRGDRPIYTLRILCIMGMNVLLTEGNACLADFGLARVKTETLAVSTGSSQAAGTLRWMAPELFSPRAAYSR